MRKEETSGEWALAGCAGGRAATRFKLQTCFERGRIQLASKLGLILCVQFLRCRTAGQVFQGARVYLAMFEFVGFLQIAVDAE